MWGQLHALARSLHFVMLSITPVGMTAGRKIQSGEVLMIFFSGFIICAGSVDFVLKKAEIFVLAVDTNGGTPFSLACVVRDSFVL